MKTPDPAHDETAHQLAALWDESRALSCPACKRAHQAEGKRILLALTLVGLLAAVATAAPGPLGTLLGLTAVLLVVVPVPPLSRWISTGRWSRGWGEDRER